MVFKVENFKAKSACWTLRLTKKREGQMVEFHMRLLMPTKSGRRSGGRIYIWVLRLTKTERGV